MLFPKCCETTTRPELISKPWKIILLNINTEENVISTENKGGKLSWSLCQEWWKTERKGFKRKAGKASMERQCHSQLTTHPCDLCGCDLFPLGSSSHSQRCLLPRSRSGTYFCPCSSVGTPCSLQQWAKGKCDWQGLSWAPAVTPPTAGIAPGSAHISLLAAEGF